MARTPKRDPARRGASRRWARILAAVLLCGGVATAAAAPKKDVRQRVSELRQRLSRLAAKKEQQQAQLRQTKRTQTRLADQLNQLYQRLEDANLALKKSEQRLKQTEAEVRRATAALREAEQRLTLQQERFGRRLAFYYREGTVSYLDVLAGANDLSDLLDRQYLVTRMASQDADALASLRAAQEEVARRQQRLVARQTALALAYEEKASLVGQVANRTRDKARLLKSINRERALQEQRLAELEEDSRDVQRLLEKERERRLANPQRYRALPRWSGNFLMPVRGRITSGFGYRNHPILRRRRLHTGIDIAASPGTPVYAAAAGEVLFASWRGGYGRCIIVLHSDGVSTLYAHLSRIDVRPGQTVRRGQRIGAVGSTGLSTGPHLHFEVRRNGVPVNPR